METIEVVKRMEGSKPLTQPEDVTATIPQGTAPVTLPGDEKEMFRSLSDNLVKDMQETKEQDLVNDKDFMFAANYMYKKKYGQEFQKDQKELVSATLQDIEMLKSNTMAMVNLLSNIDTMGEEESLGLYYLMKRAEYTDEDNLAAFGRFVTAIGADPMTYTGFGAMAKFAFTKSASKIAQNQVLQKLTERITTAGLAGFEAGAYGALTGHTEEKVKEGAGYGYDPTTPAVYGGVGVVGGYGLVKGANKAGDYLAKWVKEGEQEMMAAAGGGTPPSSAVQDYVQGNLSVDLSSVKAAELDVNTLYRVQLPLAQLPSKDIRSLKVGETMELEAPMSFSKTKRGRKAFEDSFVDFAESDAELEYIRFEGTKGKKGITVDDILPDNFYKEQKEVIIKKASRIEKIGETKVKGKPEHVFRLLDGAGAVLLTFVSGEKEENDNN